MAMNDIKHNRRGVRLSLGASRGIPLQVRQEDVRPEPRDGLDGRARHLGRRHHGEVRCAHRLRQYHGRRHGQPDGHDHGGGAHRVTLGSLARRQAPHTGTPATRSWVDPSHPWQGSETESRVTRGSASRGRGHRRGRTSYLASGVTVAGRRAAARASTASGVKSRSRPRRVVAACRRTPV